MGGVCFAEAEDEMHYRHHAGMHPHHGPTRGPPRPPPTHGMVGHYHPPHGPGNRYEEEYMNQKFRTNGFDPQHGHGHQTRGGPMHGHGHQTRGGPMRGQAGRHHDDKGYDAPLNRYESHNDDHLDNASSVQGRLHAHISPRKITQSSFQSSLDGYDDSHEKAHLHPMYPYEQDPPMSGRSGSPPGQRRKSLSERLNSWQERKRTENLDSYDPDTVDPLSLTCEPSRMSDRDGSDDYPNFPEHANRKKSLQERVAEFKDRRKNSQVRFDDESYSEAMDRHESHRDFFEVLDKEAQQHDAYEMESDHSYIDDQVEYRESRGRQESDRESRGRKESDKERKRGKKRKKSRDEKRKKSRDDKKKSKRKSSRKDSNAKDKKKRARKNSDRKGEKKSKRHSKRSKEERSAGRDRPRKRTNESTGKKHRLSLENLEQFTNRLSQKRGEQEFDTQSYQPPSTHRKTSDRSQRSYMSTPGMMEFKNYREGEMMGSRNLFRQERKQDRDYAIHE